ncbi:hypothetical protein EYC98_20830 [Halieaceae bacterium IMCC14734]|uniref:Fascin domain-containing protein n=1 Tax=Candidatus Litorirhabdus singularis TaxID=2518993 RepID=A0ABT3TMP3_9GAMM|nr:hypothetical protein [Candidatus Litorirhabdus singularis]MCX2983314.1 hypothetical protein [Candidatus Litorirhabdus singularis]
MLVDAGNGLVALQSLETENYVTVLEDGTLEATATSISEFEWFSLVENANGFYVAAEFGGAGNLVVDREAVNTWEQFGLAEAEVWA